MAETLFFDYHRQNGVDIRVVRIFNTYLRPAHGPQTTVAVSNFIVQALRGETHHLRRREADAQLLPVDDLISGFTQVHGDR